MLLIHCADIHLDSPLSGVKDAKLRRQELIESFADMVEYAHKIGAQGVLIAGDLFDNDGATTATVNNVAHILSQYSNITFFVIRGNHGGKRQYEALAQYRLPNVKFFAEGQWSYYNLGDVCVAGTELNGTTDNEVWQQLQLPDNKYNILLLHGDVDNAVYGKVDVKTLSNSGANYVALGHRHTFGKAKLSRGGVAVYSGVLESRGFDERQGSGFVVLDTVTGKVAYVPHAKRSVVTVNVDVTGYGSDIALGQAVEKAVQGVKTKDYLNLVLCGTLDSGIKVDRLTARLEGHFFALRIQNDTMANIDTDALSKELSIRGNFVKLALQSIEDKRLLDDVLTMGLAALSGEEL